jgi:hypothetical protein
LQEVVASGRIGEMIEGQYSNYVLQKIMDTAPTTVAQDLMVLLRYGGKGTVQQLVLQKIMDTAPTTVAQDLMVLLR